MANKKHITVGKAAKILAVAPNTIRSWGESGHLTEYRHPCNNYRLFLLAEVNRLRRKIERPAKEN